MICKKCGAEIEQGLMYCPKCGESIQLVPDYNVFEEELLSKVVEDKDKAKDDKFASGVYQSTKAKTVTKTSETSAHNSAPEPAIFTRKIRTLIYCSVIGVCVLGFVLIISYFGAHNYDSLMNHAVDAENQTQYAKALGYYEEAYALDSDSFEAIYGLGRMYYRVKDYKNAIPMLETALESDSSNKKIYTYLVAAYDAIGDTDSIIALADSAPTDEIKQIINSYIMLPPSFSVEPGEYGTNQIVQLTTNGDYQIFYTLNGKNPTTSGKLYSKPIELKEGTTVIKAVTQNSSGEYSEVTTGEYTITHKTLDLPVVSPTDGIYNEPVMITIAVPDGCKAYYTWDGTDPATHGTLYTEPFPILQGSYVLSVRIIDEEGNTSDIYTGNYIYQP